MHSLRRAFLPFLLTAPLLLSACASLNTLTPEVRSFGSWPEGRAPGSYAFERLPSQQQAGSRAADYEALAAPALQQAGFKPAADAAQAELIVSLGVRVSHTDLDPWADPLWARWNGPLYTWRHGLPPPRLWTRPQYFFDRRYAREVAVLLRDRATGQPLYEARASHDGATQGDDALIRALFQAALLNFPKAQPEISTVSVPLR